MRNKETEKQAYISQIAGIKNVINNPPVCRTALRCVKKSDGGTIIFTDSYRIYTLKGDDPSLKHHDESMGSYPFVGKILSRAADKHARAKTIVMIDERMTTILANKRLLEADLSRAKRHEVIDTMSAVAILETYLAQRRK